jgi:hypothetical protein
MRKAKIKTKLLQRFFLQISAFACLFCLPLGSVYPAEPGLKLHVSINSAFQELSPVLSNDGRFLFFCREGSPQNTGYKLRKYDQDIWMSRRLPDGSFGEAEHIEAPFNTTGYDFPVAFFAES